MNGVTTTYLLDLNAGLTQVLGETTGNEDSWYLLGLDVIAQQQNGTWGYFGYDGLGSVRQITDSDGLVQYAANYDPYGLPIEQGGLFGSAFGFTGEQTDANNLIYLRARYYNPALGMFQSKDPEMGYMGLAMSMNGYSYVHGNPINLTDPSGRLVFLPILAGMAVGAVSGAFMGGLLSAGITLASLGKSINCLSPAEKHQVLMAGLEGAITGAISGALTGPISFLNWTGTIAAKASILAMGVDLGLGVAWDMAVHKTPPGEAILQNIAGQVVGEAAGHVAGRALRAAVNDAGVQAVGIVLGVTAQRASASLKNAWRSVSGTIGEGIGRTWRGIRNSIDDLRVRGNPPQGAMCGFNSFSADTTVATEDGDIPISQIEIGDEVLAYNETTGETGEYTVTDTISHVDQVIVHLVIDGELIETTPEHPFYTIAGEWVEAENLTIGDLIWSLDGDYGAVEDIDLIHTQQPMYNLTVDEAHTFFIGNGDWLVHNTNSNKCFTVLFQADLEKGLDYPLPGSTEAQLVAARRAHNKAANRQLNEALNSDPSFKAWMEQNYPDIVEHVKPGKRGAHQRYAPPDWEWHHVTDQEGVLWLMSADIHDELFGILHDYPPGRGGLSIWGTKPE